MLSTDWVRGGWGGGLLGVGGKWRQTWVSTLAPPNTDPMAMGQSPTAPAPPPPRSFTRKMRLMISPFGMMEGLNNNI